MAKKKDRKKTTLPAFGFAKDLLKKTSDGDEEPVSSDEGASSAPTEAAVDEQEDAHRRREEAKAKLAASPFGFAEDLLAELKARKEQEATEEKDASLASESVSVESGVGKELAAADAAESEVTGSEVTESEATGPEATAVAQAQPQRGGSSEAVPRKASEDRIFSFADSLDAAEARDEVPSTPVRMESWLTLLLAEETFALPVDPVRQVLRISSITRVPHAPYPIRGVTNVRGRVIPVIDLRVRLELPEDEIGRNSRIIVVSSRGRLLGLLVDSVQQVVHLDMNRVQQPPEDVMTVQSDYIRGVYHLNEKLILLLDVDRALIIRESATPEARRGAA